MILIESTTSASNKLVDYKRRVLAGRFQVKSNQLTLAYFRADRVSFSKNDKHIVGTAKDERGEVNFTLGQKKTPGATRRF